MACWALRGRLALVLERENAAVRILSCAVCATWSSDDSAVQERSFLNVYAMMSMLMMHMVVENTTLTKKAVSYFVMFVSVLYMLSCIYVCVYGGLHVCFACSLCL
jgi:hypothetical protein